MTARPISVGVLGIQGDFEAHSQMLEAVGARTCLVRTPEHLQGIDALVIPGGESTTIMHGIEREGLAEPLRDLVAAGTPVLGTCAGLIVLDRDHLGVLDVAARRNAFGRQVHSFEANLDIDGIEGGPVCAVFIRAPWVEEVGEGVEVLAAVDGRPVAVRQGEVLAVAFHPELTGDGRVHRWIVQRAAARESVEEVA